MVFAFKSIKEISFIYYRKEGTDTLKEKNKNRQISFAHIMIIIS